MDKTKKLLHRKNSLPSRRPSRHAKSVANENVKKTLSPRQKKMSMFQISKTSDVSEKADDKSPLHNEMISTKIKKTVKDVKSPGIFRRTSRNSLKNDVPCTSTVEDENDDGIKTRRVQKSKTGPRCCMCRLNEFEVSENLKECSSCNAYYHISNCLKYHEEFKESIWETKSWLCARCIGCSKCGYFIADPTNVECWTCCRAWHGVCAPKGYRPTDLFDGPWHCAVCCKILGYNLTRNSSTKFSLNSPDTNEVMKLDKQHNNSLNISISKDEVDRIMQERNEHWDRIVDITGLSSPTKSKHSSPVKLSPMKKKKLIKGEKRGKRLFGSTVDFDSDFSQNIVTDFDMKLYQQSSVAHKKNEKCGRALGDGQWVYLGGDKAAKAICSSAYPNEMENAHIIYICKFCLHATHLADNYKIHWEHCTWRFPPGNEIYRKDNLSFFEVDGELQKNYCRNLCLMSKLFISSKTLYHDVETFLFYILCEITSEGFVIVGYFSKEKNPSKNNNLSCLLTLPTSQRMGYGRLLIDMSYALSRLELKIGSPEHPLSDLGILAYRGYWRSSILCYLRSIRNCNSISIKEISMNTRIHPVDVVNQLLKDNMLLFKNNSYYIKAGKRAYKHSLSQIRRRIVDRNKLVWKPKKKDIEGLDPTRINFYV